MKFQYGSFLIFFLLLFFVDHLAAQESVRSGIFVSPLDISLILSGNYGEIRSTHFHTGLDFKTEQVEGKSVYAADSGYISRISIQTGAYGKALYIKHRSGYTTVYGHLREFIPEIEEYVKRQQYRKHKHIIELYPDPEKFPVRRGQLIAYSGNTGRSSGPHLHFEIRNHSGEIPLNPLKFGFPVADNRPPRIYCMAIYPMDTHAQVDSTTGKKIILINKGGENKITLQRPVQVWGNIGFGIETYDFLNGASNECRPLAVSLKIDHTLRFAYELDKIPFSHGSYVNSHIDYAEKMTSGRKIQKLFLDPNNKLNIYSKVLNQGICNFSDSLKHNVSIVVKDAADNQTSLSFIVKSVKYNVSQSPESTDSSVVATFYYDSLNVFENENIKIVVPKDALFDNIAFSYKTEKSNDSLVSDIHVIHNELTPLNKSYILSVKPFALPHQLLTKALIVQVEKNNKLTAQGGSYAKGFITTTVNKFGRFAVAIDTVPPEINPVTFVSKRKYAENQIISFQVRDNLAGISTYNGYIDGKWALFEYEPKSDLIFYKTDAARLTHDKLHQLELIITDNKNNMSKFSGYFYY